MAFTLFTEDDFTRIIKYLQIQPFTSTGEEFVRSQMERTEQQFAGLVTVIQADLDTLDTLDAQMTAERNSSNSALIQADVLRWSDRPGARTEGLGSEMTRLTARIASLLGLKPENSSMGAGRLLRG